MGLCRIKGYPAKRIITNGTIQNGVSNLHFNSRILIALYFSDQLKYCKIVILFLTIYLYCVG